MATEQSQRPQPVRVGGGRPLIRPHAYPSPRPAQGLVKRCHMSPDAFVQMALQLAYYRLVRPLG